MTTTDTGTEPRDAAFPREEATRRRRLSVELFERNHAYAAGLVRVAAAVRGVPSVAEMDGTDKDPSGHHLAPRARPERRMAALSSAVGGRASPRISAGVTDIVQPNRRP